jgi:hypothetical protein
MLGATVMRFAPVPKVVMTLGDTRRGFAIAGSVAVLMSLLAACRLGFGSGQEVVLPMYHRDAGGLTDFAQAAGILTLEGRCLVLRNPEGRGQIGLAWPSPGTERNPSSETVVVYGKSAAVGDQVLFGGGEFSDTSSDAWVVPPTTDCVQQQYFGVQAIATDDGGA